MAILWRSDLLDYSQGYPYPTHDNAGKETDKGLVLDIKKSYGPS